VRGKMAVTFPVAVRTGSPGGWNLFHADGLRRWTRRADREAPASFAGLRIVQQFGRQAIRSENDGEDNNNSKVSFIRSPFPSPRRGKEFPRVRIGFRAWPAARRSPGSAHVSPRAFPSGFGQWLARNYYSPPYIAARRRRWLHRFRPAGVPRLWMCVRRTSASRLAGRCIPPGDDLAEREQRATAQQNSNVASSVLPARKLPRGRPRPISIGRLFELARALPGYRRQ